MTVIKKLLALLVLISSVLRVEAQISSAKIKINLLDYFRKRLIFIPVLLDVPYDLQHNCKTCHNK